MRDTTWYHRLVFDHGKDQDMDETTASRSGVEPREGVAHDVAIHTDPRVWSLGSMAYCSCGWQGPYRLDKRNTQDDEQAHRHMNAGV